MLSTQTLLQLRTTNTQTQSPSIHSLTLSKTHSHFLSLSLFQNWVSIKAPLAFNGDSISTFSQISLFKQTNNETVIISSSLSLTMALSASDVAAMYSLLANSMSADQRLRRPAEEALAQSESRPGFCSCLLVRLSLFIRVPMKLVSSNSSVFVLSVFFVFLFFVVNGKCRKWLLRRIWRRRWTCVWWLQFTSRTASIATGDTAAIPCKWFLISVWISLLFAYMEKTCNQNDAEMLFFV